MPVMMVFISYLLCYFPVIFILVWPYSGMREGNNGGKCNLLFVGNEKDDKENMNGNNDI